MVGTKHASDANHDLLLEVRRLEEHLQQHQQEEHQLEALDKLMELCKVYRDSGNFSVFLPALQSIRRKLLASTERQLLRVEVHPKSEENQDSTMRKFVSNFIVFLLRSLHHQDLRVRIISLDSLMDFILTSSKVNLSSASPVEDVFPLETFEIVLEMMLSAEDDAEALLRHFVMKYSIPFDDVQFYTLKHTRYILSHMNETVRKCSKLYNPTEITSEESTVKPAAKESLLYNIFQVLSSMEILFGKESDALSETYFCCGNVASTVARGDVPDAKQHQRLLNQCWLSFLRRSLPIDLYKNVLRKMQSHILPCMSNPLALSDFLTDSYNLGGVISILSLHGLFTLMVEHNLEYPDFYTRLYQLLQPNLFHNKNRACFFRLVWLFLKSPHLPAYMVAAFIKRFARLSLTAPPAGALVSLALIANLLRRNPSSRILISRTAAQRVRLDDGSDPYDVTATSLEKCNALDSSLWELNSLCKHYCPDVATLARVVADKKIGEIDYDISKYSNFSYHTLIDKNASKKRKVELAYMKPSKLFASDSAMAKSVFSMPY